MSKYLLKMKRMLLPRKMNLNCELSKWCYEKAKGVKTMKHMRINCGELSEQGLPEALSKQSKLHVIWI